MKVLELLLDEIVSENLKKDLIKQEGIINVDVEINDCLSKLTIQYNSEVTPVFIYDYIESYLKKEYPILINFDKNKLKKKKFLSYTIKDICCEYCYKDLIKLLFCNNCIKSINVYFPFDLSADNIIYIEYDKNYSEKEVINFLYNNINSKK